MATGRRVRRIEARIDRFAARFYASAMDIRNSCSNWNCRPGRIVCIYAHFDLRGEVADYVCYALDAVSRCGVDICFVTTAPRLSETAWAALTPRCRWIIQRKNRGRDWGSWKTGLGHLGAVIADATVLFLNDSVYGPFFNLDEWLETIGTDARTLYGITRSFHMCEHIESYCFALGADLLRSPFGIELWRSVRYLRRERHIVGDYEHGMSRRAKQAGVRLAALCELPRARQGTASTTGRWVSDFVTHADELFVAKRCPFVSRSCVAGSAPTLAPTRLRELLARAGSTYPLAFIANG